MSEQRVRIDTIATGVPGLDRVLGGGLPEFSFNLIAGSPGTGKTTLSQQIMYANAAPDRLALHFTVLGEPPLKMLRYQQQFDFFDPAKVESVIRYRNLSEEVLSGDLDRVLDSIVREVESTSPGIVVVDSFRTVTRAGAAGGEPSVQRFLQQLSLHLASWETTSFLIGEYMESEIRDNPVFTVADGVLWLHQQVERNSVLRKLQVVKVRGQAPMPGLHTFRITGSGLRVFPRVDVAVEVGDRPRPQGRLSTGVEGLDLLMNGGVPAGDSVLVAGPCGSGKTVLGTHFVAEAVRRGERAVIAVFEENPAAYVARAASFGLDLAGMVERGDLRIIYLRPLDLSADEALLQIQEAVRETEASRVVIDSLSGFEIALAQSVRDEFRESLYRMVAALTRHGVTVFMTVEVQDDYTSLRFSPHAISFLTDDLILQRYVEMEGQLRRVLTVVKMRGSGHSRDWRAYEITEAGLVVGGDLSHYHAIITGTPVLRDGGARRPGLTEREAEALRVLEDLREATVEAVAEGAGLGDDEVRRALDRVVALNYALRREEAGAAVYRPAARTLKP
jgi:circadian clock protein KaiC